MADKYITTAQAGKSITLVNGSDTLILPIGGFKVKRMGNVIKIVSIISDVPEVIANYDDFLSAPSTPLFANAGEAQSWFQSNFF